MKKTIAGISFTISKKVKDHGNDPFVVRKNNQSKATLEKYGFPEELLKELDSRKRNRHKS